MNRLLIVLAAGGVYSQERRVLKLKFPLGLGSDFGAATGIIHMATTIRTHTIDRIPAATIGRTNGTWAPLLSSQLRSHLPSALTLRDKRPGLAQNLSGQLDVSSATR